MCAPRTIFYIADIASLIGVAGAAGEARSADYDKMPRSAPIKAVSRLP